MITLYHYTSRQEAFIVLINHVMLERNLDGLQCKLGNIPILYIEEELKALELVALIVKMAF